MGRYTQLYTYKGSQKHLQRLVNHPTDPLGNRIGQLLNFELDENFIWKSPVASDEYAEYNDEDFVRKLGLQNAIKLDPLIDFWPTRGPHWDALAQTNKKRKFPVEAKSHIGELASTCEAKPVSYRKIQEALNTTKVYSGSQVLNDWCAEYYQYANRLAHLYWLREVKKADAHLVFIYFVNDSQMNGPTSKEEWEKELAIIYTYLGVSSSLMSAHIHNLFFDVASDQLLE